MKIIEILDALGTARGKNIKTGIIHEHRNNQLFRDVLLYTYNPFIQFHIRPKSVEEPSERNPKQNPWRGFLELLDRLNDRLVTGHEAAAEVTKCFATMTEAQEDWARRVLDRHLNVGVTSNTINKVVKLDEGTDIEKGLIPVFKVQLAHQYFDKMGKVSGPGKFIDRQKLIAIEPKLDGWRCIAIVRDGGCMLKSRNGKDISANFQSTIVEELAKMNKNGTIGRVVLDGELMGKNYKITSQMVRRKLKDAEVGNFFLNVFDWMPLDEWLDNDASMTCQQTRELLEDMHIPTFCDHVRVVERVVVPPNERKKYHDAYVARGFEGCMLKSLHTTYRFKRGRNVVKYKEFEDVDLKVVGFKEGKAGSKYENTLGSIVVAHVTKEHGRVLVDVGSGFNDEERAEIWKNRSEYRGKTVEIRYQSITEDGSLLFPTTRGFRPDKDEV